jgi:cytochrome P450
LAMVPLTLANTPRAVRSPGRHRRCRGRAVIGHAIASRAAAGRGPPGPTGEVLLNPFDPGDPVFLADPYPAFAALRALGPVHAHPLLGTPVAVSHAACSELLRSRSLGRIWVDAEPAADFPAFNLLHRNSLLEREGPPHDRLRTLVASAFNRGHTARLEPWVRELAHRLVGELAERIAADGSADLISGVAAALPVEVIAELLGVPEPERAALRGWSNAIVTMYEPDPGQQRRMAAEQAAADFVDALRGLVAHRRTHPGDDLVTDLVDADVHADELVGTAALLLMAGHEATVNVIGNGVLALLRHPAQWQRLREDPGLDATAVEELIRYDPPLQLFERWVLTDDFAIGDVTIPRGDKIALLFGSANRDPRLFDRPDEFDVGRENAAQHIGFGGGIHVCIGAPLARVELEASLLALRRYWPDFRLGSEPRRTGAFVIWGLRGLELSRS